MRHLLPAVVSCVLALGGPPSADAQDGADPGPLTAGTEIAVTSHYVWRGFDDGRGTSVQPNAWASYRGLKVSAWFNITSSPDAGERALTERDATIEYAHAWGPWAVSGGWTAFTFPGSAGGGFSHEAFVSVAYDGPLSPSLAVYRDFRLGSGTYVAAAAEQAWDDVWRRVGIGLSAGLGYNDRQWTARSGWSDASAGLTATWRAPGGRLAVSPFVKYSHSLDRRIVPSRAYGGVELALR